MNSRVITTGVYLASALSNADINRHVAYGISILGIDCYLPQDDPVNTSGNRNSELIAERNRTEIEKRDFLIAVYRNIGLDTSWELGYAAGLKKRCFLLCSANTVNEAQLSVMLSFSIETIIMVPEWDASANIFASQIKQAINIDSNPI
jgi:nucleoside 2-deoxyribosyltransferase